MKTSEQYPKVTIHAGDLKAKEIRYLSGRIVDCLNEINLPHRVTHRSFTNNKKIIIKVKSSGIKA